MAKYGKLAKKEVAKEMHRLKHGPKVHGGEPKNRKQAIAIGLSEARKKSGKVPPRKKK